MFIFLIFLFVTQCHAYDDITSGRYEIAGNKPDLSLNVQTTASPDHLLPTEVPVTPAEDDDNDKLPHKPEDLIRPKESECLNGKCKGQKKEVIAKRNHLRQQMMSFGRTAAEVDRQLSKTQELKKALLENMGLGDMIDPEDDGLYEGDVLLSAEQADEMIESMRNNKYLKHSKASGLFFETQPRLKWDISKPIKYAFGRDLQERVFPDQMTNFTASIYDIQLSVPCLKFVKIDYSIVEREDFSGPVIIFVHGSGCNSGVGRLPTNYITLGLGCWSTRTITHEILHTLGVWHMQSRPDRDRYIIINQAMVEKAQMHNFNIADPAKNSVYGTKYDIISIMHYKNTAFSRDEKTPTIFSKDASKQNLMGTAERLRESDKELLNRMYCVPSNCKDKYAYCGEYALYKLASREWLIKNCRRSMNCVFK